ncbi:MAG: hypothetical protein R3Y05_06460 [bacterium]
MIRHRLKEVELRITDLADYLQVSRPTMYKYIELYDEGEYSPINKKVKKLFDYIVGNELAGKNNVINYILTNLVEIGEYAEKKDDVLIKKIKSFIIENPDSNNVLMIKELVSKKKYNYFADLVIILNDKDHSKYSEACEITNKIKKIIGSIEE